MGRGLLFSGEIFWSKWCCWRRSGWFKELSGRKTRSWCIFIWVFQNSPLIGLLVVSSFFELSLPSGDFPSLFRRTKSWSQQNLFPIFLYESSKLTMYIWKYEGQPVLWVGGCLNRSEAIEVWGKISSFCLHRCEGRFRRGSRTSIPKWSPSGRWCWLIKMALIVITFDRIWFPFQVDVLFEKFDKREFDFNIVVVGCSGF